ncbi:MAG: carbon-nitrogen hydrolase family protein [Fervidicoccaceae archaeon]|nr:MAG: nitrilase [Fervidicoccus fontis]
MKKIIKIGIIQLESGKNKLQNLMKLNRMISSSSADIVITPEYFMYNPSGDPPEKIYENSEDRDGEFLERLKEIAKRKKVNILATLFVRASAPKVYNEAVLISRKGEIVLRYRKTHLFDAYGHKESEFLLAGDEASPIVAVEGVKTAVAICYDIRFPELFRTYALQGAELVLVPSGWYRGDMKEETLHFLGRARAHENTIFLVIANQYGKDFTGRSAVFGPLGEVILDLGVGEKYREISIDISEVEDARKKIPVLKQRNTSVYRI